MCRKRASERGSNYVLDLSGHLFRFTPVPLRYLANDCLILLNINSPFLFRRANKRKIWITIRYTDEHQIESMSKITFEAKWPYMRMFQYTSLSIIFGYDFEESLQNSSNIPNLIRLNIHIEIVALATEHISILINDIKMKSFKYSENWEFVQWSIDTFIVPWDLHLLRRIMNVWSSNSYAVMDGNLCLTIVLKFQLFR